MRTTKPTKQKKSQKSNPSSSRKETQGILLFERAANKYKALDDSERLLSDIKKQFDRKKHKLILSTSGDEIYYFNDYIREALDILENFR